MQKTCSRAGEGREQALHFVKPSKEFHVLDHLTYLHDVLSFGGVLISPLYLGAFVLIAWGIYLWRGERGGFWAWLTPKDVIFNKSTGLDLWLFGIGQVAQVLGLFTRFAATPAVAAYVSGLFSTGSSETNAFSPLWLALFLMLIGDFARYWGHRAHHTIKVIWPLHAVHHSAEVMTPVTAYRQHPLSTLLTTCLDTVIVGALLGVLVGLFNPDMSILEIAGVNAFYLIFNLTLTNFQHSHIWVSFWPVLERIIISPAQHQVHHSTDPAHFNKNYGQTFAIWDWMFGTLYITRPDETVTFGLDGKAEAPLMTHRLWPILWDPVRRMIALATGRV